MLHVRVAGYLEIALSFGQAGQRRTQVFDARREIECRIAKVQAQRGKHLVVS